MSWCSLWTQMLPAVLSGLLCSAQGASCKPRRVERCEVQWPALCTTLLAWVVGPGVSRQAGLCSQDGIDCVKRPVQGCSRVRQLPSEPGAL